MKSDAPRSNGDAPGNETGARRGFLAKPLVPTRRTISMTRIPVIALAFLTAAAALAGAQVIDKPVATIRLTRMQVITAAQLSAVFTPVQAQARRTLSADDKKQYLDQLVARALIEQAAERDGVSASDADVKARIAGFRQTFGAARGLGREMTDAEIQAYVTSQGMSWNDFQAQARYEVLRASYVRQKKKALFDAVKPPTDADVQDFYNYHKKDFLTDDMIRVRHIFFDTRSITSQADRDKALGRAQEIARQLDAGASFDDLQMKYSEDITAKYNSGDFGVIDLVDPQRAQQLGKPFLDALWGMRKGERSGVLVSKLGYHIVLVTDRFPAVLLGLNDLIPPNLQATVKDYIRQSLAGQWQNDAFAQGFAEIVDDLKKQAEVRLYPENIP